MHDIKSMRLEAITPRQEVEDFLTCWFDWRTTGLVIRSINGDVDVDWGDWIILCPDGTFAGIPDKDWDNYMMGLGKSQCRSTKVKTTATSSTKTQ